MKQYFVIEKETCPRCGGDKTVDVPVPIIGNPGVYKVECEICHGSGEIKVEVDLEEALKELKYRLRAIGVMP